MPQPPLIACVDDAPSVREALQGLLSSAGYAADGFIIPAIVITAFDDEPLREQSLAAGALGFLNKPIHDAELLSLISSALARGGSP